MVTDSGVRQAKGARPDSAEVLELRRLRSEHPELSTAVDLQLELLELQRRILARVPVPWFDFSEDTVRRHDRQATRLLDFDRIPIDPSDFRLSVRQTADVLHRFGALEEPDHRRIQALARDSSLLDVARVHFERSARQSAQEHTPVADGEGMVAEVLGMALRPFLTRCAQVVQPRAELALWSHPHCVLCGGEPDLAVIAASGDRHLICARCALRWRWEPITCPFCRNDDRTTITSFATPDGRYRVYACNRCQRYLKAYDGRRAPRPVMPVVDTVATMPLDKATMERGYR